MHNLCGRDLRVRAQQRLRSELLLGITDQHPAEGHDRQTDSIPDSGARRHLNGARTGPVPVRNRNALPPSAAIGDALSQTRQAFPFASWSTNLSSVTGRGRCIELRIQTQPGNAGDGPSPVRQAAEKLQRRVAAIDHQHEPTIGQPASELQHHLPSPVGPGLVTTLPLLIVAFGRSQNSQKWQCPHPSGPRNLGQQQQA